MKKHPTGEPYAGKPPVRFGGRGERQLFPTPINLRSNFNDTLQGRSHNLRSEYCDTLFGRERFQHTQLSLAAAGRSDETTPGTSARLV
jgi:hypothetical protein